VGDFHFPQTPGIAAPAAGDRRASWPGVGSNGADVLAGFGFSLSEIAELKASSAFIQTT
jgi:crotonobetainyl-CoA:carnitine CoA-transferase CaiB-like acyl-CoA transferase